VLVNIVPLRDRAGELIGAMNCFQDITDRKIAEDALRRSERLLRLVLDALPVGVAVLDRPGDIVLSNPAAQRLWGGEIRGGPERYAGSKGWWHASGERVAPGDWPSLRALVNGETSVNQVIEIESFDGIRKTVQTSAVPIRDSNERVTGAVVVNEDISARTTRNAS
jgi:PAS domain-containing protein